MELISLNKTLDQSMDILDVCGQFIKKIPEAVFVVMCDTSMNELRTTQTGLCIDIYRSRLLTAHS
jgi:hypothetical protein